jgi:hypothetical protein
MQIYENLLYNPLKNIFLPQRKAEMGNDIETSGLLWFAVFFIVSNNSCAAKVILLNEI